jgi:predicted regulator of Ras-like GTPase activity (Roadblock/LC7/MglB family)/Flp pilus assembly protein TadD
MIKTPAAADIQRWSDEVARDPRSLAFLPLARSYRRQGLRDLAMQLCLRGLDAYPNHAEAHGLLALLYLEDGDHQRAADEWSMVLRIDADNFEALRGMGFCYLEQDQLSKARQALERAALQRPSDPTINEALRVLGTRQELAQHGIGAADVASGDDPWPPAAEPQAAEPQAAEPQAREAAPMVAQLPASAPPEQQGSDVATGGIEYATLPSDPSVLFDELLSTGPLMGALLVNAQGLVLAGRLHEDVAADAGALGAVLGGSVEEAARTVAHLGLGEWNGILLEAEQALLHLAPAGHATVVVLAAKRNTPVGWLLRTAGQAADRAKRYAEEYG